MRKTRDQEIFLDLAFSTGKFFKKNELRLVVLSFAS